MILTETEATEGALLSVQRPPEAPQPPQAGFRDLLGSAARVQNTFLSGGVALGAALERRQIRARNQVQGTETPDYNPLQDIAGYERYATSFRDTESPEEVVAVKRRIDRELEDRKLLDAAGAEGLVAQIAAGVVDPINLVPVGGSVARSISLGRDVARSAGRAAATGTAVAAAAEGTLQATQETRTAGESMMAIGATTVLSGVLGAAAPLVRELIPALSARVSRELTLPRPGQVDPLEPSSIALGAGEFGSSGAMAVRKLEGKLKSALGVDKIIGFSSPLLRTLHSPSRVARQTALELTESPFYLAGGEVSPIAVETRIKFWQSPLAESLEALDDAYVAHKRGNFHDKLRTFAEFKEQVGIAMRQEDQHAIPEVESVARIFREKVFEPLKLQAIKVGLLPEDVQVVGAPSYFTRVYNTQKISARRGEFVDRLTRWLVDDQAYRSKELDRTRPKMDPYAPSTRRHEGVELLDPLELREAAEEIVDHILGVADGRIAYESVPLRRGPTASRVLNAPDYLIQEFLENDVELIAKFYARTLASDVEIARAFGTPDMAARVTEIRDSYKDAIAAAGSEKASTQLAKQRDADIRDLTAMRDRLRGTFAAPADPDGFFVRAGQTLRNWNYLSLMGSMVVSSIPDLARPVMVHGMMSVLRDGILPLVSNLRAFKLAANEAKIAGAALDMVLDSRAMELADVGSIYGRHSRFERGLQAVADRYGTYTLMNPWNAALKQFSSVITQHNMLRAALKGDGMSARELEQLAFGGIDGEMAARIARQFEEHGDRSGSAWLANTREWTDREAVKHFRAAIVKDVDRTIVTPGVGDRPLWMSSEMGKVIGQFQTFAFASVQRVMIAGLQQRDMATLNGAIMSIALGAGIYGLHSKGEKKPPSDDPAVWIREGVDRSGITGWLYEAGNVTEKFTRGAIGPRALSGGEASLRYAERGVFGALFGPSVGRVEDLAKAIGGAVSQEFRESDVKALRRILPFQNLFYLRQLFDQAQEAAAGVMVD